MKFSLNLKPKPQVPEEIVKLANFLLQRTEGLLKNKHCDKEKSKIEDIKLGLALVIRGKSQNPENELKDIAKEIDRYAENFRNIALSSNGVKTETITKI